MACITGGGFIEILPTGCYIINRPGAGAWRRVVRRTMSCHPYLKRRMPLFLGQP